MRILLDTHILIWSLIEPQNMPAKFRQISSDRSNEFIFSAVNIWEVAIKHALGRRDFELEPDIVLGAARAAGLDELPVRSTAAARVGKLPLHHRDPFDRLLVAQAVDEQLVLLTDDAVLPSYGENVFLLR